jgi:hypothetical protein
MSLNTLLFPLLTHREESEWYTPGGLANNIFWVAISSAFIKPLFTLIGPQAVWKLYRRWDVKRGIEHQSAYISQGQANQIFQNNEVDVAAWYADIMIKFLLCLAYTPLLPLIVPIILLGFGLEYWIDKWLLLRQSCRPRLLNEKIAFFMIDFVKPALVLYGISILIFFSGIDGETSTLGIAAVILACAFWFCHFLASPFFRRCFKESAINTEDYSSASPKFTTVTLIQTYKLANPFTHFDNCREDSLYEEIHPAVQEHWDRHYLANRFGLLSATHTHVCLRYTSTPTTAPLLALNDPFIPRLPQVFLYPQLD